MVRIQNTDKKVDFDYFTYAPRTKKVKTYVPKVKKEKTKKIKVEKAKVIKLCCDCNTEICLKATRCEQCYRLNSRKVSRPSKEELEKLVWEFSGLELSRKLGVSDVAIAKWCKQYGIKKPNRGYWAKKSAGKI